MPCFFIVAALAAPRAVVVVLWLFTHWFRGIFSTSLWPIVGFIFLPTTMLWYTAVQHWFGGQWTLWPIVGLVVALTIDMSPAGGRRKRK
ncbi:MAG TPA: hypothetical protein VGK32_01650 [Vicinamibacterales bacterium]|jgi:hypothetical protein